MLDNEAIENAVLIGQLYASAVSQMNIESVCILAVCTLCGAKINQYCLGQFNKPHPGSLHGVRRRYAHKWKKDNPEAWAVVRGELIKAIFIEFLEEAGLQQIYVKTQEVAYGV